MMYRVTALLAKARRYQLVATLWDPPESVTREFGLDRISRTESIDDFDSSLACCRRLGVISEAMGEHYKQRHSTLETTVMRFIPCSPKLSASRPPSDEFIICFAGSAYASREFRALLDALDHCRWKIAGRSVRVQILGAKINYQTKSPACIEFLVYRSGQEVAERMAKADCGYVPYWFDPTYDLAVRLCFPSKLITCLTCRTPIFFHGPEQSSPAEFLKKYRAGIACHSLDRTQIVSSLNVIADADRKKMASQADLAVSRENNTPNFHRRFQFLIPGKRHD